jgi:hypothetical protein
VLENLQTYCLETNIRKVRDKGNIFTVLFRAHSFNRSLIASMHCMAPSILLMLPVSVHHTIMNALKGTMNLKPLSWTMYGNLNPCILDGLTRILMCPSSLQIVIQHSFIQI